MKSKRYKFWSWTWKALFHKRPLASQIRRFDNSISIFRRLDNIIWYEQYIGDIQRQQLGLAIILLPSQTVPRTFASMKPKLKPIFSGSRKVNLAAFLTVIWGTFRVTTTTNVVHFSFEQAYDYYDIFVIPKRLLCIFAYTPYKFYGFR